MSKKKRGRKSEAAKPVVSRKSKATETAAPSAGVTRGAIDEEVDESTAVEIGLRKKVKTNEEEKTEEVGGESMKECLGLRLFVPFNNIFKQCLKNLLSRTWEIRHYSAMVLKGFLKENVEFLDFEHSILMKDIDPKLLEENNQHTLFSTILTILQ